MARGEFKREIEMCRSWLDRKLFSLVSRTKVYGVRRGKQTRQAQRLCVIGQELGNLCQATAMTACNHPIHLTSSHQNRQVAEISR